MAASASETAKLELWNAARRFLERGCRLLDCEDYEAWLAGCGDSFQYTIQAFSQEIRRDVIWLDKDREGLRLLFKQLPMHERYRGAFRRMLGWTEVSVRKDPKSFSAESAFCVYHVDLEGTSKLYCTGRYLDELSQEEDGALALCSRTVLMDTRRLPFGSHVPI